MLASWSVEDFSTVSTKSLRSFMKRSLASPARFSLLASAA